MATDIWFNILFALDFLTQLNIRCTLPSPQGKLGSHLIINIIIIHALSYSLFQARRLYLATNYRKEIIYIVTKKLLQHLQYMTLHTPPSHIIGRNKFKIPSPGFDGCPLKQSFSSNEQASYKLWQHHTWIPMPSILFDSRYLKAIHKGAQFWIGRKHSGGKTLQRHLNNLKSSEEFEDYASTGTTWWWRKTKTDSTHKQKNICGEHERLRLRLWRNFSRKYQFSGQDVNPRANRLASWWIRNFRLTKRKT